MLKIYLKSLLGDFNNLHLSFLYEFSLKFSAHDKNEELARYDKRAAIILSEKNFSHFDELCTLTISRVIQKPYLEYVKNHKKYIQDSFKVLEIGAGIGAYSKSLVASNGNLYITDISSNALKVFRKRYSELKSNIFFQVADMEKLPFEQNSFDIISSAGSLSYGDNKLVMDEIIRVLRPKGLFICIDSLNENPIYKFNRWVSYKRGKRSLGTITNMPTLALIEKYTKNFDEIDMKFFGSIVWLYPFLKFIFGENMAARVVENFDQFIGTRNSAFKFVLVLRKKL